MSRLVSGSCGENAMPLVDRLGGDLPRAPVTVELDDIQATVLRYRPEPYYGTHVMLHVEDAQAGREFVQRLTPYVDSAADWWQAGDVWTSIAISSTGLVALGLPEDSLRSFPEAFRVGMAARADKLRDYGPNDPTNWDRPFGTGEIHIAVSIFSDTEDKWRRAMETAGQQYQGFSGVTVMLMRDFGAQPGDLNPLGYKDSIGQPAIEGCGVDSLPGQGPPIKAGEFILGYPGEAGVPLPMPLPDVLGRNGTFVGLRNYQARVGTFNRFLREHAQTEQERELLAAKLVGRWRSGAPLTLAPTQDDPALGADARRNNDFTYAADPHGRQVPLGSHMRRMNPRDTKMALLADVNLHRIIRRSTTYGAPYDPDATSEQDDEVARGTYFIFLSAKAMATMEFLQQEWINNGNFMDLGDERDPNVGLQEDGATFTIPQHPVRRRIHGIQTFNVLRGGEYFFMPSLSALRWIGELRHSSGHADERAEPS
ncbi:peroxidase [Streptomyces filipinensis]|uniref:Peroxidase n=1 Tax=Streptomyces filipinensis TaxID=66887 RepID=A0A918I4P2_9ACTN|nr:peroxidase [Streptomyces filipinensis]GGU74691.1 peroxidase [Streptomyces filipinensis]